MGKEITDRLKKEFEKLVLYKSKNTGLIYQYDRKANDIYLVNYDLFKPKPKI